MSISAIARIVVPAIATSAVVYGVKTYLAKKIATTVRDRIDGDVRSMHRQIIAAEKKLRCEVDPLGKNTVDFDDTLQYFTKCVTTFIKDVRHFEQLHDLAKFEPIDDIKILELEIDQAIERVMHCPYVQLLDPFNQTRANVFMLRKALQLRVGIALSQDCPPAKAS